MKYDSMLVVCGTLIFLAGLTIGGGGCLVLGIVMIALGVIS